MEPQAGSSSQTPPCSQWPSQCGARPCHSPTAQGWALASPALASLRGSQDLRVPPVPWALTLAALELLQGENCVGEKAWLWFAQACEKHKSQGEPKQWLCEGLGWFAEQGWLESAPAGAAAREAARKCSNGSFCPSAQGTEGAPKLRQIPQGSAQHPERDPPPS